MNTLLIVSAHSYLHPMVLTQWRTRSGLCKSIGGTSTVMYDRPEIVTFWNEQYRECLPMIGISPLPRQWPRENLKPFRWGALRLRPPSTGSPGHLDPEERSRITVCLSFTAERMPSRTGCGPFSIETSPCSIFVAGLVLAIRSGCTPSASPCCAVRNLLFLAFMVSSPFFASFPPPCRRCMSPL